MKEGEDWSLEKRPQKMLKPASANPRPLKLFSAALQLSLEIVLLEKNQQNH
jgi:hypothetical protein